LPLSLFGTIAIFVAHQLKDKVPILLALKHHYLFRSGRLGFGLKPGLKIGS